MVTPAIQPLSSTSPVSYQSAKAKAFQLISAFNTGTLKRSSYYPNLSNILIVQELKDTINNTTKVLSQEGSSLCGPAAFFFTLAKVRPDIYVQLVIDLYNNGQAKLKNLKLQSSPTARQYTPTRMRDSDWMLLSSIKPNYDNPNEQWDGITLPGKLKEWFTKAGFTTVEDYTNLAFNKGIDTLLQAQNDYANGHRICLFVDANIFAPLGAKSAWSLSPNHWVVMTSDVKIRKFNEKTHSLAPAAIINQSIVKSIEKEIQTKETDTLLNGEYNATIETEDKIVLDAFTWGNVYSPVTSRVSVKQDARLSYFLSNFYGYIKVKR